MPRAALAGNDNVANTLANNTSNKRKAPLPEEAMGATKRANQSGKVSIVTMAAPYASVGAQREAAAANKAMPMKKAAPKDAQLVAAQKGTARAATSAPRSERVMKSVSEKMQPAAASRPAGRSVAPPPLAKTSSAPVLAGNAADGMPHHPADRKEASFALRDEIGKLRAELAASQADNERLTADVEGYWAWRRSAEEQLGEFKRQISERDSELMAVKADVSDARAKLAAAEKAQARAEKEAADAERVASNLGAEMASQKQHVERLSSELAASQADVESLAERGRTQEQLRRQMHETISELKGNIRVFCRIRPSDPEPKPMIRCPAGVLEPTTLDVHIPSNADVTPGRADPKPSRFKFDRVFDETASQSQVFDEVSQLTQSALDGYKVNA